MSLLSLFFRFIPLRLTPARQRMILIGGILCSTVFIFWTDQVTKKDCPNSSEKYYHVCLYAYQVSQAVKSKSTSWCRKIKNHKENFGCSVYVLSDKYLKALVNLYMFRGFRSVVNQQNGLISSSSSKTRNDNFSQQAVQQAVQKAAQKLAQKGKSIQVGNVLIYAYPHEKRNIPQEDELLPFQRLEGESFGIQSASFSLLDFAEPLVYGKGVASVDLNQDGWDDLLFAAQGGVDLYWNLGGLKFHKMLIRPSELRSKSIFLVAPVDWNNDGFLDIFLTAYNGDRFVILSRKGKEFQKVRNLRQDSTKKYHLAVAAAFYDLDQNNYPDVLLGHWSYGDEKNFLNTFSQNILLLNGPNRSQEQEIFEPKGETLSVLFSDINQDQKIDLLIGNDVWYPDVQYMGTSKGLRMISQKDQIIPAVSMYTMSIDSGDFNNDLELDLFFAGMNMETSKRKNYCEGIHGITERKECQKKLDYYKIVRKSNPELCKSISEPEYKSECYLVLFREYASAERGLEGCSLLRGVDPMQEKLCLNLANSGIGSVGFFGGGVDFPVQLDRNVFLQNTHKKFSSTKTFPSLHTELLGERVFQDRTQKVGLSKSYWTWNAKFADLDNDTWQDIYAGNGLMFHGVQSNVFFHNKNGKFFVKRQKEFGLEDFIHTPAYSYTDLDNDGDIDIVAQGVNAPIRIFLNQNLIGNSITFSLRDLKKNSHSIGAKVYIYYGGKYHQMRELKVGGGFLSFDSYKIHFGLGKNKHIQKLRIIWSDGSKDIVEKKLLANHHYKITRQK